MNRNDKCLVVAKILATASKGAASSTANSRCAYVFHQPKVPTDIKKLRKF